MKKKRAAVTEADNKRRQLVSYGILIVTGVLILLATGFITWNWFIEKDLVRAFVINFVGTSLLIAGGVALCVFFLHLIAIIVFKNPQRIKKSSVAKFAVGGIITLSIVIFLLFWGVNEARKSLEDMNAYANADWQVKDLVVTDVYRGSKPSKIILINTAEGEMVLHWERFRVQKGQTYRFAYLDATKTIINVELIQE